MRRDDADHTTGGGASALRGEKDQAKAEESASMQGESESAREIEEKDRFVCIFSPKKKQS